MAEHLADLPQHIATARDACQPVEANWLIDRLSTMQLAMTSGWSEAKATAWLHEMQRLLVDLPQDILSAAIDQAIKSSERGFMPTIGEIRAIADPRFSDRQRILRRLEGVAALPAADTAPAAKEVATADEIEAIKAEVGLVTQPFGEAPKPLAGPARMPTLADYAALGVDRAVLAMLKPESG